MKKKPEEMTREELWQLFPIFLTEHNDCFAAWYREEESLLSAALPDGCVLSHIGSTAIPGIWAKPIVDILADVPPAAWNAADRGIRACGYRLMNREPTRLDYNKGYTPDGFAERVFHLHLRLCGDRDEVFFRDYLTTHPDIAREYEALKLSLWKKYEHDRDSYTNAKGAFIARVMANKPKK